MPFSKFDPNRPAEAEREGTTASADRRAKVLRWGNWVLLFMTLLGFMLMAFWISRK